MVSRAHTNKSGARTWAEEGEWSGVSAGESVEVDAVSSSPLKALGAATGEEEGAFSRRHRKISGTTTGAEEIVSVADFGVEIVCDGNVS